MTPNQFHVIGGPSKFDLSNASSLEPHRPVVFANCPVSTAFEVYVLSVQAEDGSGESWNIEGRVGEVQRPQRTGQEKLYLPEQGQRVFLYFRTDRRQGHVKFFERARVIVPSQNWIRSSSRSTRSGSATVALSASDISRYPLYRSRLASVGRFYI